VYPGLANNTPPDDTISKNRKVPSGTTKNDPIRKITHEMAIRGRDT
jgi:hypothetical protein